MPFTIDHAAAKKQMFYDPSKPQEKVPEVLPENWLGTSSRGLPVREIPFYAFPCVLYLHPLRPSQEIEHRNDRMELVHTEIVPTEHLTKTVSCEAHKNGGPKDCADCNKVLKAALEEGWVKEPYIPEAPPKKDEDLYGPRKK
jgi:hypothetical protein